MAVGIIVIGCFYLISPERMTGSLVLSRLHPMRTLVPGYALKESGTSLWIARADPDADHGHAVGGHSSTVEAIVPFGDMSIVLGSGGSRSKALPIHGVTCVAMLVVGLLLIHAI